MPVIALVGSPLPPEVFGAMTGIAGKVDALRTMDAAATATGRTPPGRLQRLFPLLRLAKVRPEPPARMKHIRARSSFRHAK